MTTNQGRSNQEHTDGIPKTMRAAVAERYGPPSSIEVRQVPTPTPGPGEILIRVGAAALNPLDWFLLNGRPYVARLSFGLLRPKRQTPGADVAGVVVACGDEVTSLQLGAAVWGECAGSLAEYVATSEDHVVARPAALPVDEAAGLGIAGITALQALRDVAGLQAGQRIIVNGASGGVGTFAVQIAVSMGAHVTGVCSGRNTELVRSLGAHQVIDYEQADFLDPTTLPGGDRYDVVMDNVGNRSMRGLRDVLTADGVVVVVGGPKTRKFLGPVTTLIAAKLVGVVSSQRFESFMARVNHADLCALNDLVDAGALRTVIDRSYRLDESADAVRHLETGRTRGKVVVVP
jgi:NADPH:quinone reductase-like Zn-dependent oxidoreductase